MRRTSIGVPGPMPHGQPSRVCEQVLVDPWIGMAEDANVYRSPNCDGSIYFPSQQLSDASSYANQRLADVDAMCDPNDPVTAEACKVYEMFQILYGAVDQEIRRLSGGGLLGTLECSPPRRIDYGEFGFSVVHPLFK